MRSESDEAEARKCEAENEAKRTKRPMPVYLRMHKMKNKENLSNSPAKYERTTGLHPFVTLKCVACN